MSMIAVVDAQKNKMPTEEIVQKSNWWKRFRKEKSNEM
jgi:CRISPR/Cas system CMR-associated protein Cmr5 small subunit